MASVVKISRYQKNFWHIPTENYLGRYHITVQMRNGPEGRGGLQRPQIFGNSDFLGSKRKFGQSQFFKDVSMFFIIIILKR